MSLITIGPDPLPGYTATMQFLETPAGQTVVNDLHNVIVDLVKFFHQKHIVPALNPTEVNPNAQAKGFSGAIAGPPITK